MSDEETPSADSVSAVLRLRGLPFTSTEDDVKEFFEEYNLQQIFLCKRNGRANGEAYVQLDSADAAKEALQTLNRKHMGKRYIEVFEAQPSDLLAVKTLSAESRAKGYVVRLRGLPYSAASADIEKFFEGLEIVRGADGVLFTYTPDGRPTGEAYVEFDSEAAHKEAMKRHKELIGTRYIELFVSSKADMYQAMQHNKYVTQTNKKRWLMHGGMIDPSGVRHMAPYGMGVDEMSDVFRGFSLGPRTVPMVARYGPAPGDHIAAMQGAAMGYMQMDTLSDGTQQRGGRYSNMSSSSPIRLQSPAPSSSRGAMQPQMGAQAYGPNYGSKGMMQGGRGMGGQMSQQQMMNDYGAQQQMMMQQQYMMQQQMMSQQQVAWGGSMPGAAIAGAAPGVAGSWYKGYGAPGYGVASASGYASHGGYGMAMPMVSQPNANMGLEGVGRHPGSPQALDVTIPNDQASGDGVDASTNGHATY